MSWFYYFRNLNLYYVFYSNHLFIDKNKQKDYQIIDELLIDVSSIIKYVSLFKKNKIHK